MAFSFGTSTANPTPSFGGNAGFGSFGQPAASGSTFTFGNPAPATPFGTNTNTSTAPGTNTTPSTNLFGNTSAPSNTTTINAGTSLFGNNATATNTTTNTGGSLFGNATTANTSGNSLFGNTNTTTSLFGQKPATGTTGTTGGLFGQSTGGLFGQSAKPGLTLGGFGSSFNAAGNNKQARDKQIWELLMQVENEERQNKVNEMLSEKDFKPDYIWQALALLKAKWDPSSPFCQFKYYFYNMVPPQEVHLYVKPPNHDTKAWEDAQKANPDPSCMVPALAVGFEDLKKRIDAQENQSAAHKAKLTDIETKIKRLQQKEMQDTYTKLSEYKRRHMDLAQRFLKHAQVLRNKGLSITPEEEAMRVQFENIQTQLLRSDQFHGKLSQMWAQLQLIKESGRKYGKIDGVDEWDAVSDEHMTQITNILGEQQNGIQHVIENLQTDIKEIDTINQVYHAHRS
ncbi:nucleoporin complex subunit 54-domain-containing protein [Radiomyces spectabilis]|uniref:nucleoporin complex subunit 54-domain-containing protein n=1 Tax=Radiomyces spectabilis TaxID=64574 RepID=UPI00221F6ED5|nr:nucleoporin complex subunit 54-domain-containing protein [Radiomyces spectabilis]KAI8369271.1 nucleoporin complex subunit 54-domain-containing protein [Radiomyces spectabilis]